MDSKLNFVKDGALHLPPGFRFQPTEEEIVFQYLTRKTYSRPLPASVIPEINNIRHFNPRHLPGDHEQDRYFFSNVVSEIATNNYKKRNKLTKRNYHDQAGSGSWKQTGTEKKIEYNGEKRYTFMGIRRTLVYSGSDTRNDDWYMHEYRLSNSNSQIGYWTLCHVFLRQSNIHENGKGEYTEEENQRNGVYDLQPNFHDRPSSPTSSCSSSSRGKHMITDVTSHHKYFVDDQEESSSCTHGYNCSSTFGDY